MKIIEGGCYHLNDGPNGHRDPEVPRKLIILVAVVWVVMFSVLLYWLR